MLNPGTAKSMREMTVFEEIYGTCRRTLRIEHHQRMRTVRDDEVTHFRQPVLVTDTAPSSSPGSRRENQGCNERLAAMMPTNGNRSQPVNDAVGPGSPAVQPAGPINQQ